MSCLLVVASCLFSPSPGSTATGVATGEDPCHAAGDASMQALDDAGLEIRRTRSAIPEGALIGGVAGAVLGAFLSTPGETDPCGADFDCFEPKEPDFGMDAVLIGGLVGG